MSDLPLVSILIPVYNAARFVRQAVCSALNQTYRNIEVIAVDDGSMDSSYDVLCDIQDERFQVFRQINQGADVARNRALQESKGEYIKFLDADDYLYPDAIETQVEQMSSLGENEEVFGDFDFVDENGELLYSNTIDAEEYNSANQDEWLFQNWTMSTSAPLHRRALLLQMGGFDVRLKAHQESTLHIAMSIAGVRFVYRPARIYAYRNYESEDRITCARERDIPRLEDAIYHWEKLLGLVQSKYGNKVNLMTDILCRRYAGLSYWYAFQKMSKESEYCLHRCLSIPHSSNYPQIKGNLLAFRLFYCLSHCLSVHNAFRIVNKYCKWFGISASKDPNSKYLLGNK